MTSHKTHTTHNKQTRHNKHSNIKTHIIQIIKMKPNKNNTSKHTRQNINKSTNQQQQ